MAQNKLQFHHVHTINLWRWGLALLAYKVAYREYGILLIIGPIHIELSWYYGPPYWRA